MTAETKSFAVTLHVQERSLSTLLGCVTPDPGVELVRVEAIQPASQPPVKKTRYAGGVRDKGVSAEMLLLRCAEAREHVEGARRAFRDKGFAENSLGAAVSSSKSRGYIEVDDSYVLRLLDKGKQRLGDLRGGEAHVHG